MRGHKAEAVFLSISVLSIAAVAIVCAIHICVVANRVIDRRQRTAG